jgi:hypothetical protein
MGVEIWESLHLEEGHCSCRCEAISLGGLPAWLAPGHPKLQPLQVCGSAHLRLESYQIAAYGLQQNVQQQLSSAPSVVKKHLAKTFGQTLSSSSHKLQLKA